MYRAVVAILTTIVRALRWRVRFTGLEHVPVTGPAIIAANHVSYVDPILVGLGIERRGRMVRYLAKRELFDHWFTGPVMRGADQILVDRRRDGAAALRHAEAAMAEDKLVVIFPEATIHPRFAAAHAKSGTARLALACGVPVIPAAVWGGQQVATKGGRRRPGWRTAHEVRFGPPVGVAPGATPAELTGSIMAAIAALLESAAADHPADLGPALA